MPIQVTGKATFGWRALQMGLAEEGILAEYLPLPSLSGRMERPKDARLCFVVEPDPILSTAAEAVNSLRAALAPETFLVLCTPERSTPDRQILFECGASSVIAPRSWAPEHVAERLLSVLIDRGLVTPHHLGDLYGGTARMRALFTEIQEVACFPDPVLITGETGSGKELIAREIHRCSGRPDGMLAVNCAELAPEVVESELFGHARGAFTGADRARDGLLASAGEGSVWLDEIGEASPSVQAKLLRAIEQREVRPVGSNKPVEIKARILLGTHRCLGEQAGGSGFRQDLFHRIAGVMLQAPPLRDRRADIPLLSRLFLDEMNRFDGGSRTFAPGAQDRLFDRAWPGNVRELRAAVRRAAMGCPREGGLVRFSWPNEAPARREEGRSHTVAFDPSTDTWARVEERARGAYLRALLDATGGDKPQAIARSGIGRSQFYEYLKWLKPKGD